MKIRVWMEPETVSAFYHRIAEMLGYDPADCTYDCTQIEVSPERQITIESIYPDPISFSMTWANLGPKVNEDLTGNEVYIHDKFIREVGVA